MPARGDLSRALIWPAGATLAAAAHFLSTLKAPTTVLAAVSGGSDSTGLLLALHAAIAGNATHRLVACTVDHALRAGSAEEASAVARRCADLSIPHRILRWTHDGPTTGLQMKARLARYGLLADAAQAIGATVVVTGHTADDQAETIAMRASRGPEAESPGLAGMADAMLFSNRIWVCRPFLRLSRENVRNDLRLAGESWIEDPSNADITFERARIRQLPGNELVFDAGAAGARLRSGARIARMLETTVRVHEGVLAEIALHRLALDDPDGRRMLTVLASVLGGRAHAIGQDTARRLFTAICERPSGRWTAGRVMFERRGTRLYACRERRGLPEMVLTPGAAGLWDERFRVENRTLEALTVTAGGQMDCAARLAALPSGLVRRALSTAPQLRDQAGRAIPTKAVGLVAAIAPYDTVLPRFDLMMANSLAALFGREPYLKSPVHDVSTEMEA